MQADVDPRDAGEEQAQAEGIAGARTRGRRGGDPAVNEDRARGNGERIEAERREGGDGGSAREEAEKGDTIHAA